MAYISERYPKEICYGSSKPLPASASIRCTRMKVECVEISADLDDMLALAADQNFVPVVDSDRVFLGIIRRKDIIEYYTRNIAD
jgi:CBS domain containing-hemolysin-like protein